jgi:hypothetical protein
MMFCLRSTCARLALALSIGACQPSTLGDLHGGDGDGSAASDDPDSALTPDPGLGGDQVAARRDAGRPPPHDAGRPGSDAATRSDAATGRDAGHPGNDAATGNDAAIGGGPGGNVSCYASFSPGATCALPTHCCFTNYSWEHNGECSTSTCTWGTIDCDGPEDCGTGQHCCAHAIVDPDEGMLGYRLACQASACGAAPANQEMCHPTSSGAGSCSSGTCVAARDYDFDLPGSLHICQ